MILRLSGVEMVKLKALACRNRPWITATAILVAMWASPIQAEEPKVITRLRSEPITLFDYGMKRLRAIAVEAARRLSSEAESGPRARVWYDVVEGAINVEFRFFVPQYIDRRAARRVCLERRRAAIRETFLLRQRVLPVEISLEGRIKGRLGLLFSHEPAGDTKEARALGERLAELTFLAVRLIDREQTTVINCRGLIASSNAL